MSIAVNLIPPTHWIPICIIGLLTMIINCFILIKEMTKRLSDKVTFLTNYLKIWSVLCIISSVLFGFFSFVQHMNIFCHFGQHLEYTFIGFQGVFMGFYQLSRLYYCFAQTQVYSNKGYSNLLFLLMYTIGIIVLISAIISPWFILQLPIVCGINDKLQYDDISIIPSSQSISFAALLIGIVTFVGVVWDFITLSLYIIKVISFKMVKSKQIQYDRIMAILNRIIILTILYEITAVLCITVTLICARYGWSHIIGVLYNIAGGLCSVAMSLSMFLMQHHNDEQYYRFLKLLLYLKIHHICCCFKSTIIEGRSVNESESVDKHNTNNMEDTICDTRDNEIKNEHSKYKNQLSIATTLQKT